MRACVSWLKQWVDPGKLEKLAEQLTLAGLEVARIEPAGELSDRTKVVIGRIISCSRHPDAERLFVRLILVEKTGYRLFAVLPMPVKAWSQPVH